MNNDIRKRKSILVTGANGFIGGHLCRYLEKKGCLIRRCFRNPSFSMGDNDVAIGDINGKTSWDLALKGIDVVIHLAGKAHSTNRNMYDSAEYDEVNCEGTRRLASEAAFRGVRRFIFLSSIAVYKNGLTQITDLTTPEPETMYGISKLNAELAIQDICKSTKMEYVILRPPLVYGPNAPGNIARLKKLVFLGLPLPFASIHNKRSLISVTNLAGIIHTCLSSGGARNEVFLVSDTVDISTCGLMKMLGREMERKCHFFPFPERWLYALSKFAGGKDQFSKAFGSLVLDTRRVQEKLNWIPAEIPFENQ